VIVTIPDFAFAPAKNVIKKKPPRPQRRPGAPERGVHAASARARPLAWKISNALATSDAEAG
jgi:hypothetical protein